MITLYIFTYSYILGSISPSLIIGKIFFKVDIREHGSKNLGGSNAGRVLNKKAGIVVMILDVLKGVLAVWITSTMTNHHPELVMISGLAVIFGHLFPVFAKFRGGKGIATTAGVMLFIQPILIPISLLLLLIFWLLTKYESLATLITYTCLLLVALLFYSSWLIGLFAMVVYLGVLYAHRYNISALIQCTEKKKNIFSRFE